MFVNNVLDTAKSAKKHLSYKSAKKYLSYQNVFWSRFVLSPHTWKLFLQCLDWKR